jgi:hypothetical protein
MFPSNGIGKERSSPKLSQDKAISSFVCSDKKDKKFSGKKKKEKQKLLRQHLSYFKF